MANAIMLGNIGGGTGSDTWETLDFIPTVSKYWCDVPITRTTIPNFLMMFTDDIMSIEPAEYNIGVGCCRSRINNKGIDMSQYMSTDGSINTYGNLVLSIVNGNLRIALQGNAPRFIVGRTYHLVYEKE